MMVSMTIGIEEFLLDKTFSVTLHRLSCQNVIDSKHILMICYEGLIDAPAS